MRALDAPKECEASTNSRSRSDSTRPRTILADLVDRLTEMGAVVIGFDVVFAEPDQLSPNLVALNLRDLDDATRARLRSLPSNDEIFAAALRRSRVVLGESVSDRPLR